MRVSACAQECLCVHITLKLHDYRDCIHNIRDGPDAGLFFLLLLLLFVYTRTTQLPRVYGRRI